MWTSQPLPTNRRHFIELSKHATILGNVPCVLRFVPSSCWNSWLDRRACRRHVKTVCHYLEWLIKPIARQSLSLSAFSNIAWPAVKGTKADLQLHRREVAERQRMNRNPDLAQPLRVINYGFSLNTTFSINESAESPFAKAKIEVICFPFLMNVS